MNDFDGLQIVSLIGCLVLAASALTGYRLSWKRGLVQAMIWASIFALLVLIVSVLDLA